MVSVSLKELAKDAVRVKDQGGIGRPRLPDNLVVYSQLMTTVNWRSKTDWEYFKQKWADFLDKEYFSKGIAPDSLTRNGFALRAVYRSSAPELQLALNYQQDLTRATPQGRTALMRAASRGLTELTYMLVKAGAPVEAKDMHGLTAFYLAVRTGHVNTAEILQSQGKADESVTATVSGYTALQDYISSMYRYGEEDRRILKSYLKLGLDFDFASTGISPRGMLQLKLTSDEYTSLFN